MSFTETIAAGRAFARPGDPPIDANRELVATGLAQPGGALLGRDAGGRRNVADRGRRARSGGRTQLASLVTAAAALATMLLLAPLLGLLPQRDAGGGRHRLLGRPDQARRIRRHPHGAAMEFRWAVVGAARRAAASARCRASSWRSSLSLIGLVEPGRRPDRPCHRPQARRRRPAAALARASGRRDLRGPADPAARGPPVLRQRAERRRSDQRR